MNQNKNEKFSNWCALPFFHLSTNPKGDIQPCCKARSVGNIEFEGLREAWNNYKMKEVRKSFMEGKKPESCNDCWQDEEAGITSFRQRIRPLVDKNFCNSLKRNVSEDGSQLGAISYLELKLSNTCNLMCRMCSAEFSSKWQSYLSQNMYQSLVDSKNQFKNIEVKKEIMDIINNPDFQTICFAGGEPFLDKNHFEILERVENPSRLTYIVNTNFTNIIFQGKNILNILDLFKEIRLIISIDGDGLRHEYIRCGIHLDVFEKNLLYLKETYQHVKWKVYSSATISLYNVHYIPELIEYSLKFDLIPNVFTFVSSPGHQCISLLPTQAREKIYAKVSKWFTSFDLMKFIETNGLERLSNHYLEVQDNLNKSIASLFNAFKAMPIDCEQRELFFAETKKIDILYNRNLSATNASLESDLKND